MTSPSPGALPLSQRGTESGLVLIVDDNQKNLKLGRTWETTVHKRVTAVILYLAESG